MSSYEQSRYHEPPNPSTWSQLRPLYAVQLAAPLDEADTPGFAVRFRSRKEAHAPVGGSLRENVLPSSPW